MDLENEHFTKTSLTLHLSDFAKAYNRKFPNAKINEREFDILHEFVIYLSPMHEIKKLVSAST